MTIETIVSNICFPVFKPLNPSLRQITIRHFRPFFKPEKILRDLAPEFFWISLGDLILLLVISFGFNVKHKALASLIFSLVERSRNQEKICAELSLFRPRSTSESFLQR